MSILHLAVNGGLMRGMRSNFAMLDAGAMFVREDRTAADYRLWSIDDRFPAMLKVSSGGHSIALEVWSFEPAGFVTILNREPPGLSVAKVTLGDGTSMLGVVAEAVLCEGRKEITAFGGWRAYLESLT